MTDNWDSYFLQIDDKAASISVDLGARAAAPRPSLSFMAYVHLHMNSPSSDGLSSQEEFDNLVEIEDSLKTRLVDEETEYVGCCTNDSCLDFFFYVAQPREWGRRVNDCMNSFPAYSYGMGWREDAAWSTYLLFLYPNRSSGNRLRSAMFAPRKR